MVKNIEEIPVPNITEKITPEMHKIKNSYIIKKNIIL